MGNYHEWGDEDFDWASLGKAERLLNRLLKLGRIGVHTKEKYGTLRASIYFFSGTWHDILYPGYVYNQYSFLREQRWYLDIYFWPKVFYYTGLSHIIRFIQMYVFYTLAYYLVMKKYPHIKEEICVDADYPELIIGGQDIHDKYWTTFESEKETDND